MKVVQCLLCSSRFSVSRLPAYSKDERPFWGTISRIYSFVTSAGFRFSVYSWSTTES